MKPLEEMTIKRQSPAKTHASMIERTHVLSALLPRLVRPLSGDVVEDFFHSIHFQKKGLA
jgi:hypothetical protein